MGQASRFDTVGYEGVVSIIDNSFAIVEQHEFLQAFLCGRNEVLLMGFPYIRDHADSRCNNRLQAFHLVRLRDTRLENA